MGQFWWRRWSRRDCGWVGGSKKSKDGNGKRADRAKRLVFVTNLPIRLTRRCGRNEAWRLMCVMFVVFSDPEEPLWHVKRTEDCRSIATERAYDAVGTERFPKENLKRAVESVDSSAFLHSKTVLDVLPEQLTSNAPDSFLSIWRCSRWNGTTYFRKLRGDIWTSSLRKSDAIKKDEALYNIHDSEIPMSFLGLIQKNSGRTAACLIRNALVPYPVYFLRLSLNAKEESS